MTVINRLKRLTGEEQKRPAADPAVVGELRRRIEEIMERRPRSPSAGCAAGAVPVGVPGRELSEVIEGFLVENDRGACFVSDGAMKSTARHGRMSVADMVDFSMDQLALLAKDRRLADLDAAGALFLDTETTGLSGGTGTTAFLIGLGWFEGSSLVTRQIFLRDFADEAAALAVLMEAVRDKKFLVTFNGKAFDVNLLATRFVMNRLEDALSGMPHLDLLFPSRRLLGHRLENCRLGTLEEEVLSFRRRDDVPGYEIPGRYFEWLRRRDGELVRGIFEHNRFDLVSMAALVVHLAELVDADSRRGRQPGDDLLAAARLRIDREDVSGARRILEFLVNSDEESTLRAAAELLSLLYRREGKWGKAVALWERMISDNPGDVFAVQELAKWYEHRRADYEAARALVDQALNSGRPDSVQREALLYRRDRLCRRCGVSEDGA